MLRCASISSGTSRRSRSRYFSEQRAGWIISRITNDVDALSDVLSEGLSTLVGNVLTLTGAMIALAILDWRLGTRDDGDPAADDARVTRWFQTRSHVAFADVRTRISALTAQVAESLAGMAVIQSYNRERAFRDEFAELNARTSAPTSTPRTSRRCSSPRSSCSA